MNTEQCVKKSKEVVKKLKCEEQLPLFDIPEIEVEPLEGCEMTLECQCERCYLPF